MNPSALSLSVPPDPDFAHRLSEVLRLALEKSGWRFSCEGSEFTSEEVAAPDGMLSMWLNKAQGWMAQSLGGQAGHMAYRIDGDSLCGVRPDPQAGTASLAVWALYAHYAIEQHRRQHLGLAMKGQPVPMDDLYRDWHTVVRSRQIPLLPPAQGPSPALGQQPAQGVGQDVGRS